MSTSVEIVHFTSVHSRSDTRIYVKQCRTLIVGARYSVSLFVQDGLGDEHVNLKVNRVRVVDTGPRPRLRILRAVVGGWRMWRAVRSARPVVAHFHDPELIPVGLALRLSGIKVIYDVHEDVPRQILNKQWLPALLRRPFAWSAALAEWVAARVLDGVVTATPKIAERFPEHKTTVVQNFPVLDELIEPSETPYLERAQAFAYVGVITGIRGWNEIMAGLAHLRQGSEALLEVAGSFNPVDLQRRSEERPTWSRVRFHGWADRSEVAKMLGRCRAGLVLFHPAPNHLDAQPNKMFEYMSAGLPVIASDFPLWREIIEGASCGLLVDPLDPSAIAKAMEWILDNPKQAEMMGQRGREAVMEQYNWENEAKKLVSLYQQLLPTCKNTLSGSR